MELDQIKAALEQLGNNGKESYKDLLKTFPAEVVAQAMDVFADMMPDDGYTVEEANAYAKLGQDLLK